MPLLRQSHRPAQHGPVGGHEHLRYPIELRELDAGGGHDRIEIDRAGLSFVVGESRAVCLDEGAVDDRARCPVVGLQQQSPEPREQCHVASDGDLGELVGDRDPVPNHTVDLLRVLEAHQTRLR